MGNCLKTKLKGVINNDNLEILGSIIIPVNNANNYYLSVIYTDPNITLRNTMTYSSGVTVNFSSDTACTVSGTGSLVIREKYKFSEVSVDKNVVNFRDFRFSTELTRFAILATAENSNVETGILASLPQSLTIIDFSVNNTVNKLHGSVKGLGRRSALLKLKLPEASDVTGTMAEIADYFPSLNDFGVLTQVGYTGDIIDFVKVRIDQSILTGSVTSRYANYSNIKFNGNTVPVSSGNTNFSWEPAETGYTNISCNGTTVKINNTTGDIV